MSHRKSATDDEYTTPPQPTTYVTSQLAGIYADVAPASPWQPADAEATSHAPADGHVIYADLQPPDVVSDKQCSDLYVNLG